MWMVSYSLLSVPHTKNNKAPMDHNNLLEVQWLQQRLETVTQWHERAEAEIARLRQCPDQTVELRQKVERPDIAIPLLQSYDATITEKDAAINSLRMERDRIQRQLEERVNNHADVSDAAKLSEERANVAIEEYRQRFESSQEEVSQLQASVHALQQELQIVKERASSSILNEARCKDEVSKASKARDELAAAISELKATNAKLQEDNESLLRAAQALKRREEDVHGETEAQKMQLHFATRENDDKVQEIERLRNKMVQALKQAADNHTTHLRLVEEKHRSVQEQLREELRTYELTVMKLRAQLSKVDLLPASSSVKAPSDVLDQQLRHAQEVELKRISAENTALLMQRDDALFQIELLKQSKKTELDEQSQHRKQEIELLKHREHELEERCTRLAGELDRQKDALKRAREEFRRGIQDNSEWQHEKLDLTKKVEDARRALAQAQEATEALRVERAQQVEDAQKQIRLLERRLEDARRQEQVLKEQYFAESTDSQKALEACRMQLRESLQKLQLTQSTLNEKERLLESATLKLDRLNQGLSAHKQQLQVCDERINELQGNEQQYRSDLRGPQSRMRKTAYGNG